MLRPNLSSRGVAHLSPSEAHLDPELAPSHPASSLGLELSPRTRISTPWKAGPASACERLQRPVRVRIRIYQVLLLGFLGLCLVSLLVMSPPALLAAPPTPTLADDASHLARSFVPPLRNAHDTPSLWSFQLITDLDKASRDAETSKPQFHARLQEGVLERTAEGAFTVHFGGVKELHTSHNEAGRGFELSELVQYDGKLWTADDRSGIVYEILTVMGLARAIPRAIIMEGSGVTDKGLKVEWATTKDGLAYFGSIGKEWVNPGDPTGENLMWVATMDQHLSIHHQNWTDRYKRMREATGTEDPGYLIHEAIQWSPVHRKWVVLPRRVSLEDYDEVHDETRGSDLMIIADDFFEHIESRHVGPAAVPSHGFSSFKFLPDTSDEIILAVKSEENEALGTQSSYLSVFTFAGETLMEEVQVPGDVKFEGVEFV